MEIIPNILAERYASEAMQNIWSTRGRVILEREFWVEVMRAQRHVGIAIPEDVIADYERVKDQVDLDSIRRREAVTRHDVKARIEEFCALAGHQHIHKGMTSRDLTENVEQRQVFNALKLIRTKTVAALIAFRKRAEQYKKLPLTARTHNVAAQMTTFGKRLAMFGEELYRGYKRVNTLIEDYPLRGLKGAVGTQLDQLTLCNNETGKVQALEKQIFNGPQLNGVGQVYPRSLDFEVISALVQIASGPSSFAKTLRLMAGHELASEGFAKGQVGSSAMPHKMNSRNCERLNGFHTLLRGYSGMAADLTGDQWNEGDVSCSVVRRVVLPDSFFTLDGLLETLLNILGNMEVYEEAVAQEKMHYLPFLITTTLMMEAVKSGIGREVAHAVIKEHALATVRALRTGETEQNDLLDRLAADERLKFTRDELGAILSQAENECGAAEAQVDHFIETIDALKQRFPEAEAYQPMSLL